MILYGKPVAEKLEQDIKIEITKLAQENIKPFLAVILVGEDPASILYTRKKREKAENLGIGFRLYHLPLNTPEQHILDLVNLLNSNKEVHGLIIQLPLPENLDTAKILAAITPKKDIDGLNGGQTPPAAAAVLEIINFYNIDLMGKKIVLVGHGKLVGAPLEKILTAQGVEVLVCDSKTNDLKSVTLSADIIISGVGKPGLITPEMVRKEATVIDAGTAESKGSTVGDVDTSVYEKVDSYTPVPGGVGPVTVACLMKNLIDASR